VSPPHAVALSLVPGVCVYPWLPSFSPAVGPDGGRHAGLNILMWPGAGIESELPSHNQSTNHGQGLPTLSWTATSREIKVSRLGWPQGWESAMHEVRLCPSNLSPAPSHLGLLSMHTAFSCYSIPSASWATWETQGRRVSGAPREHVAAPVAYSISSEPEGALRAQQGTCFESPPSLPEGTTDSCWLGHPPLQ
jgi:hypothetical protein